MNRLEQLIQMLEQEPADDFLNHALAMEYLSQQKVKDAIAVFKNILQRNPSYLPSYYQLGQALEKAGANEEAIAVYKAGIELAKQQNNKKAQGELSEALWMLED